MNVLGQRVSPARLTVGVALGGIALWLSFRGLQWNDLAPALSGLDRTMIGAALLSTGLTLVVGTLRWQLIFYPRHRELHYANLFRASVIGQMVNILSPVRVGEIARLYALAEREPVSKAQVVATLALEKVLDLFVFGLAVAVLLALMAMPEGVRVRSSAQLGVGMCRTPRALARRALRHPDGPTVEPLLPRLSPRWRRRCGRRSSVRRGSDDAPAATHGVLLFDLSWRCFGAAP